MQITKAVFPVLCVAITGLAIFAENIVAENPGQVAANKERMIQTVRFLSETNFPRTAESVNKEKTIEYIVKSFSAAGISATREEWVIDNKFPFTNIHALKKGKTNKRIIVGAHFDTVRESPGADDNASAIAVLIELAHILKVTTELNCDVELVAYDLEEAGLIGSRTHADKLKQQNTDVVCMICMDMVGYYSDAERSQDYPVSALGLLYGTKGDFLALVGKPKDEALLRNTHKAFQEASVIRVVPFPVPLGMEILLSRSDHGYFWKEGYPALFLTDTAEYRNKNYHKPTDTWNTLDYDRLAQVPMGLYNAILTIDAAQVPR